MNINATMFGQMLTFAVLIWFTMKFIWPPLIKALDERQKKIADGLEAAQRGASELALAHQKANDIIREARNQAAEIVDQANKRANGIVDEAKDKAREEANKILVAGQAELGREISSARDKLRADVVTLAIAGARKVLEHEVDSKAHAGMLEKLAAQI